MVGDIMQGSGDTEAARAAYSHPKPGSLEYGAAQAKLAWTYQAADDKATALKLARAGAASGDADARITLADLLRSNEQYAEAAEILTGLINEAKTPRLAAALLRAASAYERMNKWPEAQADLQAALDAAAGRAGAAELPRLFADRPRRAAAGGHGHGREGRRRQSALGRHDRLASAGPTTGWATTRRRSRSWSRRSSSRPAIPTSTTTWATPTGRPDAATRRSSSGAAC